jgi:uncharacterized membrane protein
MTERPESLAEAVGDRDITLALTPGQLILLVVGVWLLVRVLRGLRR